MQSIGLVSLLTRAVASALSVYLKNSSASVWDVSEAVALAVIFFLERADGDGAKPLRGERHH